MHRKFDHKAIEGKWQENWQESGLYATDSTSVKPKCFVLDMFPYPSGEGLHVGHPKGYIATDIYSRFKRMTGHEVLHQWGGMRLVCQPKTTRSKTKYTQKRP